MNAVPKAIESHTDLGKPIMTVADLSKMTEGSLLCVVEILLKPKYPYLKPHEIIPQITGASRSHVDMCKCDKGYLGGANWKRLEFHLDSPLYHQWLEAI